jgi:glycosyltransferase involved in cell wall biosynthesis
LDHEEEKAARLEHALAAAYLPFDEDSYGYPTIEAAHARRPTVTASDSGGVAEFVQDGETGLVAAPEPEAVAAAFDRLHAGRALARRLGANAAGRVAELGIDWDTGGREAARMNVLVLSTMVPFVRGGAEELCDHLVRNLRLHGVEAEAMRVPFSWEPAENLVEEMLVARSLNIVNVDRLIPLKFPAYLAPHPNKVPWLLHQYRQAYDLFDVGQSNIEATPRGEALRGMIRTADDQAFRESRRIFTLSPTGADRLRRYNGFSAELLPQPLNDPELFPGGEAEGYVLASGRVGHGKRQHLLVRALRHASGLRLVVAGPPDRPEDADHLRRLAAAEGVEDRLTLDLRFLPRAELARLVNGATAVAYLPFDEDFGRLRHHGSVPRGQAGGQRHRRRRRAGDRARRRNRRGVRPVPGSARGRPVGLGGGARARRPPRPERPRAPGFARHHLARHDREAAGVSAGLRIAWAGPWNARSSIASFGALVVAEIAARGHEVEVFRTETGEFLALPPRPAPGPVSPLAGRVHDALARDYDAFIVNLGDHYGHHGAAVTPLLRLPALAIIHDAFLANLYAGWAEAEGRPSLHGAVLGRCTAPRRRRRPTRSCCPWRRWRSGGPHGRVVRRVRRRRGGACGPLRDGVGGLPRPE